MADDEQFSLCWNNFNTNLSAGFHESLCRGDLVDVTLAAEGQMVKAHRLVLSVCSPYFRKMFTQMPANQHAFVFLKDVSHSALKDLIQFMYCGEVNVKQEALPAFISTAEALQIKGLTDSDPPAAQSPPDEPTTPTTQQIQQMTSPRVQQRQRTSTSRSYKIETVDDTIEESKPPPTQIVIQTTTAPTANTIVHHQPHLQQQQQQQQPQLQAISSGSATVTTAGTTLVQTNKRTAQRSNLGSNAPHIKRTKSTIDPLDTTETTTTTTASTQIQKQQQPQQITLQTSVVTTEDSEIQQVRQHSTGTASETEYIDLPTIELPTKSEPEFSEDASEVVASDQDAAYVEDDAYGDMRYDESYFTENEDGTPAVSAANAGGVVTASTSKAVVKQQGGQSFSDSSYVDPSEQGNSEAQDAAEQQLVFIESPWATPCLVLNDFMYNCHTRKSNKEYWRCHNYSKRIHAERCRSRCVLENGKIKNITGGLHNHPPHTEKIERMLHRSRFANTCGSRPKLCYRQSLQQQQTDDKKQLQQLQQLAEDEQQRHHLNQQAQLIPVHNNLQITATSGTTIQLTDHEDFMNASLMLIHD